MKLKKMFSLVAAGVMAVSMLAGCSTTSVEPTPTPNPDEDNTQVSGYSQMLYNQLGYSAKKKVTAEDSSAVNQALETAMGYAAGNTIANSYDWFINGDTNVVNADWTAWGTAAFAPASLVNGADALINALSAQNATTQTISQTFDVLDPVNDWDNSRKIAMLFVADGQKGMNAVMDEIADMINREVETLQDDYDSNQWITDNMDTDYDYTMSVAADTITLDADHGKSMTFVAVEITRI